MPNKMRWRYGDTNPVAAAVDADTVIEIGDLLWQDEDDAKPASMLPCIEGGISESLAKNFLGVAMQRSPSGGTDPVRVATTGVFEFDCMSAKFELGDLVGCSYFLTPDNSGGDLVDDLVTIRNQQVAKTDALCRAIGRVTKRVPELSETVLVDIRSTVMTGGV